MSEEKVGVIWFRCKVGLTDKEVDNLAADFFKQEKVAGGKFHQLESRKEAKELLNKFEKAFRLADDLKMKKDNDLIFDKNKVIVN